MELKNYQKELLINFKQIKDIDYIFIIYNFNLSDCEFGYIGKFQKLVYDSIYGRLIFKPNKNFLNNINYDLIKIKLCNLSILDDESYKIHNLINNKKFQITYTRNNKIILNNELNYNDALFKNDDDLYINVNDKVVQIIPFNEENNKIILNIINNKINKIKQDIDNLNPDQKNIIFEYLQKK